MADSYNLKAGHTITVTANEGRVHVRSGTKSSFTRSSVSFGPYLVDTDWLVDGDATVSTAEYTSAFNAYVYPNAGAPEDAAQATLSLNPTGDDNALIATARVYGAEGNSISIEYVDPGVEAPLSVSVFRQKITVNLANDANPAITSTAAEVKAAIEAHTEANQLVSLVIDTSDSGGADDGSGVVTALSAASLTGGAGTGIGIVPKGGLVLDTTNGALYQNTGTLAAPTYTTNLSAVSGDPVTVDIALSAGAANVMTITLTVQDAAGDTIAAVHELEWWISDLATGLDLTADSFSGDVATTTGVEWEERTSKKHYTGLTAATGILVATVTDTNKPADIYVAVRNPSTGEVIVSEVSGANWGA